MNPPVGLWYSDVGRLDTVYQLFRYKDGDDRQRVRAAMYNDAVFSRAARDLFESVQRRRNIILTPTESFSTFCG